MYQKATQRMFLNSKSAAEQLCWPIYTPLLLCSVCLSAYQNGPWCPPYGLYCSREPRNPGAEQVWPGSGGHVLCSSMGVDHSLDPLGTKAKEQSLPLCTTMMSPVTHFSALLINYKRMQYENGCYHLKCREETQPCT